jgi:putative flippase GtrA
LVDGSSSRFARAGRLVRFGAVGATGVVVNQVALWAGAEAAGLYYLWAAVLATQVSSTWNFVLSERWVFDGQEAGRWRRLAWFTVMNNAWMVLRLPLLWALTDVLGIHYLWSNLIAIVTAATARFFVADRYIWASPSPQDQAVKQTLDPRHHFDIHGIVRISSDRRLPELEAFRVDTHDDPPDLEVLVGHDGLRGLDRRVGIDDAGSMVSYREPFRGLGFAVRMELDSTPVSVRASRLLGRSPHVLYTNVVEPLLRWLLVRRGVALVHGACLEINGTGVLITAQTDTGKTTTCLQTIREHDSTFLSDDMVLVDHAGKALAYPKPLTVSAHTLEAVAEAPLPLKQKLLLQIQSRVHSKAGRRLAMRLCELNLPVGTMNALTQIVVPPPKFSINELIPHARVRDSIEITHMIVIERGQALIEALDHDQACHVLLANTEDAYGFPPYPFIAPVLCCEDGIEEAAIHRSFLQEMTVFRVRTPNREWYRLLPELILPESSRGARSEPSPEPGVIDLRDRVSLSDRGAPS